jgi:hypothetical protein
VVGRWHVHANGIREFSIGDVDGGGLAFTRGRHPVLQQHTDPVVSLRITRPPRDLTAATEALWHAHVEAADDWIAPERFLGPPERLWARLRRSRGVLSRGPLFLQRRYVRALLQHGAEASVSSAVQPSRRLHASLGLLHFGNSFVVASSFSAGRAG